MNDEVKMCGMETWLHLMMFGVRELGSGREEKVVTSLEMMRTSSLILVVFAFLVVAIFLEREMGMMMSWRIKRTKKAFFSSFLQY